MAAKKMQEFYPKYVVAGKISRDFVIPFHGSPKLDFLGGAAAFTATGLALWDKPVGILTRIGEDYPREWLNEFAKYEIDTRGVEDTARISRSAQFLWLQRRRQLSDAQPCGDVCRPSIPISQWRY